MLQWVYLSLSLWILWKLKFQMLYSLFNSPLGYFGVQWMLKSQKEPHSSVRQDTRLHIIPCAHDNYGYLLMSPEQGWAVAIDPTDAQVFLERLEAAHCVLRAILCTHKHWDHTGGNAKLLDRFPEAKVYGHAVDFPLTSASAWTRQLTRVTDHVEDQEILEVSHLIQSAFFNVE